MSHDCDRGDCNACDLDVCGHSCHASQVWRWWYGWTAAT